MLFVTDSKTGVWCGKWIPAMEVVAKNTKALNHEEHEGHKGKEKLFVVLLVSFVVPFFSGLFATASIARMTAGWLLFNVYPENGYLSGEVAQEHRLYNFHSQSVNCRMAKR